MSKLKKPVELKPDQLRWHCKKSIMECKAAINNKDVHEEIIGQDRAVKALRLGMDLNSAGYNIFVTGITGTGRKTTVKRLIEESERYKTIPTDKIFVNNFDNPDAPLLISLTAGKGKEFREAMDEFIKYLQKNIPELLDSDNYQNERKKILDQYKAKEKEIIKSFEKHAAERKFALVQVQMGPFTRPDLVPVHNNKPVSFEQLSKLIDEKKITKEEFEKYETEYADLTNKLEDLIKKSHAMETTLRAELKDMDHRIILPEVELRIRMLKERFPEPKLHKYLDKVKKDILDELPKFRTHATEKQDKEKQELSLPNLLMSQADPVLEYRVNLVVDNSGQTHAPVIFENSPTYRNLFGAIERVLDVLGHWRTDFTKIKSGAILKAEGGFLVVDAWDMLTEPGVWPALKRVLRNCKLEVHSHDPLYVVSVSGLKPEPIEVDVKIVLVGDSEIYNLLNNYDPDFHKIFKVRAEFDSEMNIDSHNLLRYQRFIDQFRKHEKMLGFDNDAVSEVIEHGVRLAGKNTKISTRFNDIADLLRESNYWAKKDGTTKVTPAHVRKAVTERNERNRLPEEKVQEMIIENTLMIDTSGYKVGQVNGLAVYDMGEYMFGKPARITARVFLGTGGVVNIEREADLSGRIHDKGVLILTGYLRAKYAKTKPMAINATLCFEQSYSGVDGDSASSTEIYALLSAISELPLRQEIAVTGSVNQNGEVQAIGGVNQKIEGFFDVCSARGLTGTQGVIIPEANIKHLMLRHDIVESVTKGKFHIYPINTIDEGIAILTTLPAGKALPSGGYEKSSVNWHVDKKLDEYIEIAKKYRSGDGEKEKSEEK
ncbi:MAG: ATP-binding protein [Elusimicrobiota bacterium]